MTLVNRIFVAGQRLSSGEAAYINEKLDELAAAKPQKLMELCQHEWRLRCIWFDGHPGPHRYDIGEIPAWNVTGKKQRK